MRPPRRRYTRRRLLGDAAGGFVAALIALPYGLAMATLMGLPPALGIFTSLITAPITAILGRNPVLIGGTSSVTVPFVALAVHEQGIGGSAKVCIAASLFMMLICLLRLGRYVSKIPHSVVSGFSCGIGAMMVISQLRAILGLPGWAVSSSSNMIAQLVQALFHLGESRTRPILLGSLVIASAFAVSRRWPKSPAPLIGVLASIALANLLGWREARVGQLSFAIPPLVGVSWAPGDASRVLPSALGLAVVTSVNLLITSRVVEHFRGRHVHMRRSDADAELGAYGIANLCAGMFGAPVSVGIPARSLANLRCGGTTRLSNLFHAGFLALLVGVGSGAIAHIPLAALAGVTAYVGLRLLDWSTWRRLPRMRRVDAAAFLSTAVAVLCVNAVAAVALGCSLFAIPYLRARFFRPGPVRTDMAEVSG